MGPNKPIYLSLHSDIVNHQQKSEFQNSDIRADATHAIVIKVGRQIPDASLNAAIIPEMGTL